MAKAVLITRSLPTADHSRGANLREIICLCQPLSATDRDESGSRTAQTTSRFSRETGSTIDGSLSPMFVWSGGRYPKHTEFVQRYFCRTSPHESCARVSAEPRCSCAMRLRWRGRGSKANVSRLAGPGPIEDVGKTHDSADARNCARSASLSVLMVTARSVCTSSVGCHIRRQIDEYVMRVLSGLSRCINTPAGFLNHGLFLNTEPYHSGV